MTRDLKRISIAAIVLLVLVRVSIGWQFLYEGLWKIDSQGTANPWTAEGYLKAAQGPFRDTFRSMVDDPDDLTWLDYDTVSQRWDSWYQAFVNHYMLTDSQVAAMKQEYEQLRKEAGQDKDKARRMQELAARLQLDARQKDHLNKMIHGDKYFAASLMQLPEPVKPHIAPDGRFKGSLADVIRYDAKRKLLLVSGTMHLAPHERDRLLEMAPTDREASPEQNAIVKEYQKAVKDVFKRSTRYANHEVTGLAFKERLAGALRGDPERYGYVVQAAEDKRAEQEGRGNQQDNQPPAPQPDTTIARVGKVDLYKQRVREYNEAIGRAETDYQWDHLNYLQNKLQELKAETVLPVQALDAELKSEAQLLLTDEQLAKGPIPMPMTRMQQIDLMTMWSLTIIGLLLIAGLFTPFAALGGAVLLTMFYLVIPPWTGVPEAPGPEHSWVVNKNFIEALILLAIVFLPTGRWFGVDAIFNWMWVKLTRRRHRTVPVVERRTEPLPRTETPRPATVR